MKKKSLTKVFEKNMLQLSCLTVEKKIKIDQTVLKLHKDPLITPFWNTFD